MTDERLALVAIRRFLAHEAALLDDGQLRDWVELFTDDAVYRVPRRITREHRGPEEISDSTYYFDDTKDSLKTRVDRFETEYAWSEMPPTRTVRLVTNILVDEPLADEFTVRNNLLLEYDRGERAESGRIAAQRRDTLRRQGDEFRIARRVARMNTPIASTPLSFFL